MRYTRIWSQIWQDPEFRALGESAQLLFLYLLSSPHSNMVGYYRLPQAYLMEDTRMHREGMEEGLEILEAEDMAFYREPMVLLPNFLKHNMVKGEKQIRGALIVVQGLPPQEQLDERFVQQVQAHAPVLLEAMAEDGILYRYSIDSVSIEEEVRSKKEKKKEKEEEALATFGPLVSTLEGSVKVGYPAAKTPGKDDTKRGKWANDLRLLAEAYEVGPVEVLEAIRWVAGSDFWASVIRSPNGLRKNWETIQAQRGRKTNGKEEGYRGVAGADAAEGVRIRGRR